MEPVGATYKPLGSKTLFMILLKKSGILLLFLPALVFLFLLVDYIPVEYVGLWSDATNVYVWVLAAVVVLIVGIGSLEYARYGIITGEKSLKIRRGLISVEELGIPYRRIKDANIRRSLIDQLFEVSNLAITVLDTDDDNNNADHESVIVLPALPKNMAIDIQDIILRHAQVEEMNFPGR